MRPAIVFVRPRHALNDQVVDVEYTQQALVEHSGGVDGTLLVAKIDHTGHANPIQAPEAYDNAITDRVEPFIDLRPGENLGSDNDGDTGTTTGPSVGP